MKKYFVSFFCLILAIVILVGFNSKSVALASSLFEDMSAKSYIVMDSSGNVLLEKNPHEKHEVASICKLMTMLITLEHIESGNLSLDDKIVASKYACDAEGSQAFLDAGSEYSVRDLLKSVIVASANDSAIVLAESIGGSENNFVKLMNEKAREIGMNDTLYANSTGLPDTKQYSTAYDTALLLNKVSLYNIYKEDCKIWMDKLIHPSGRETELVNTNRLIKYYPSCLTGKTGYTDEAGYCLSSTAEKNNLHLTCVVLGCDSMANRFKESIELYNYAFANFLSDKIVDKNNVIDNQIKVVGGKETNVILVPEKDYFSTQERNNNKEISIVYDLPKTLNAPLKENDVVGKIIIMQNNKPIGEVNVIVASNVDKQNYKDVVNKIINNFALFK